MRVDACHAYVWQTKVQRLPASSWGAISALAGGGSTSLGGQQENMAPVCAPGLRSATGSLVCPCQDKT